MDDAAVDGSGEAGRRRDGWLVLAGVPAPTLTWMMPLPFAFERAEPDTGAFIAAAAAAAVVAAAAEAAAAAAAVDAAIAFAAANAASAAASAQAGLPLFCFGNVTKSSMGMKVPSFSDTGSWPCLDTFMCPRSMLAVCQ